jgi:putative endonuclease
MVDRHPSHDAAAVDRAGVAGAARGPAPRRSNQILGRWGEAQAAAWYEQRGGVVVDRNWRCDRGELDLVVVDDGVVVFVEVKARSTDRFGAASAAVGEQKQQTLRMLAARWFTEHPDRRGDMRFDVIAITGTRLEWIPHAF